MKARNLLLCAAAILISLAASAQDLKPVRDKNTKKYGYQDKSKHWVIEPAFDKAKRFDNDGFAVVEINDLQGLIDANGDFLLQPEWDDIGKFNKLGLCEVTRKEGRHKRYGVADLSGRLILPADCYSVNFYNADEIITARRDAEIPPYGIHALWGVYDIKGNEVFSPQFDSSPSFRNGRAIATSGTTGLVGIISADGRVLVPLENLAATTEYGGFIVLRPDFRTTTYDSGMNRTTSMAHPGYVAPYDPQDDDVRLAAWGQNGIGMRLHRNQVKEASVSQDTRNIICTDLDIDWGGSADDRFIRLEPFVTEGNDPDAMREPNSGQRYTLKAILYEADGRRVGEASSRGWIEAECEAGLIYHSDEDRLWLILPDINYPAMRSFRIPVSRYHAISHDDVYNGLGLGNELDRMHQLDYRVRRMEEIRKAENAGITSYLPRPVLDMRAARVQDRLQRSPVFRRAFHMGEVVNCRVKHRETDIEVELSDRLVLPFEDRLEDPRYVMETEEEIFWGPHNARTVRLLLEAVPKNPDCLEDDLMGSDYSFRIVLALYEEDGQYLRTLASAPFVDYAREGVLVFEPLGIAIAGYTLNGGVDMWSDRQDDAFRSRSSYFRRADRMSGRWGASRVVKFEGDEHFPKTLSALEGIMLSDAPRRFGR